MLNLLPTDSKIFIFQADQLLSDADVLYIEQQLTSFLPTWATHGEKLTADFEVVDKLFIIVGNNEQLVSTSGCSKDSLTHKIKDIGDSLKIDFFNRLMLAYLNSDSEIELANIMDFKTLMQQDIIRQNTIVFNNLIETKADLENNWKIELKNSWHKTLAPIV